MPLDAGVAGLASGLNGAVVELDGAAVGMGRVVGDEALYSYLQDVVVHPAHQRRGLGAALVDGFVTWSPTHAVGG